MTLPRFGQLGLRHPAKRVGLTTMNASVPAGELAGSGRVWSSAPRYFLLSLVFLFLHVNMIFRTV